MSIRAVVKKTCAFTMRSRSAPPLRSVLSLTIENEHYFDNPYKRQLQQAQNALLKRFAEMGSLRQGSVCEQFRRVRRKDGTMVKSGPYPMYTRKKHGKTVGKRLTAQQVPLYRAQIDQFRDFQDLCRRFDELGEQRADLEVAEKGGARKKTPSPDRGRKAT